MQPNDSAIPVQEDADGRAVESVDLLRGGRELLIRHRGETYRLRLTGAGKLILVK